MFAPYGTDGVDHLMPGGDQVAVTANIHDMDGMFASLQTTEMREAMDRHGVIQPVTFFVEAV